MDNLSLIGALLAQYALDEITEEEFDKAFAEIYEEG